ncbi:MAG: SAF domain-containing protein [Actinobacteria bacterium]|nr:SAF domain-containing protein [Actinomycetota bacterium]MCL6105238.1 SAF domain-containing protein [Actinomycetota bacterium]
MRIDPTSSANNDPYIENFDNFGEFSQEPPRPRESKRSHFAFSGLGKPRNSLRIGMGNTGKTDNASETGRRRIPLTHPTSPSTTSLESPWASKRSPMTGAVGACIIILCALLGAFIYSKATVQTKVLVASQPIEAGQIVTQSELSTAKITGKGIPFIPASKIDSVIGLRAQVSIVPGVPLSLQELGGGPPLKSGFAVVGLNLKAGQYPVGLHTGNNVIVILTGQVNQLGTEPSSYLPQSSVLQPATIQSVVGQPNTTTPGSVLVPQATIYQINSMDSSNSSNTFTSGAGLSAGQSQTNQFSGNGLTISVVVPAANAPTITAAAASGDVGLALLPKTPKTMGSPSAQTGQSNSSPLP